MTFSRKFHLFAFTCIPVLASCAFPGQYLGIDPSKIDQKQSIASNGIDYRLTPIDAISLQALQNQVSTPSLVPASLRVESPVYQYTIGVGDVVRVTVWDHPELTNPSGNTTGQLQGQVVLPDGTFYFPFLSKVKAAGRTTDEIRAEMTKNLEAFIRSPQVDVTIQANGFRSQKIYISGEVRTPGFFPITDVPLRLSDALSQAGGLSRDADIENVTLQRSNQSFALNAYRLLYEGDLSQNILLQNGDVLNIPDRRLRKVFLMGEVVMPRSFVMPVGKLTLAEVLSDVGGINQNTSNASQVYVIRQPGASPNGEPRALDIFHLDSSSPTSVLYADQFAMQPRDVVYVDPVRLVRINRLLGTILPSLQVLPAVRSNIRVLEGE